MSNKEELTEKAKLHFLGKGYPKANCAQAVASVFTDELGAEVDLASFDSCGGGRAPGGECGALYAAKTILEKSNRSEQIPTLEKSFQEQAGALSCREIRGAKKLPCIGCVKHCAEFLGDCADRA